MNRNRTAAFLGVLFVVAAATGTVMYLQGDEGARSLDAAGPTPVMAQDVPEAAAVHEGARTAIPAHHAEPIAMKVYAAPTCGCCGTWVDYIRDYGFEVEVEHRNDMGAVKEALGLPAHLASCHTAVVNDYVIEGHVPGDDLRRFLAEAPAARGLTVPGMPLGSPGMEVPTGEVDAYEVLTFNADGPVGVYARHGPVPPAG
jgi:hypothetical protein